MAYHIQYMDSKGAGCMRSFGDPKKCWEFMNTLRIRATVRINGVGDIVGRVEHRTDGFNDYPDTRRQWFGWLDTEAEYVQKNY